MLISGLLSLSSCGELLEIDTPKNQLTTDKVFTDTTSAKAALLNVYLVLESQQYGTFNRFLSVYTDESISSTLDAWNQSRLPAAETNSRASWTHLYSSIYQCNMVLEQLTIAPDLPAAFKTQLSAEALFLRAYAYFYLVNVYGAVPLLTSTDVDINRLAPRAEVPKVYAQIISDLTAARADLPVVFSGSGKTRASKAAATAMLSRVAHQQGDWSQAESLATALISSGNYTPLDAPANAFKSSSKESILQFATQNGFVAEATSLVPASATTIPGFHFSTAFYQSFESNDLRRTAWMGSNTNTLNGVSTVYRYPAKYKNRVANTSSPENLIVLRLAEQYLIRAEARARQGKLTGTGSALEDINIIRARAGLSPTLASSETEVLEAIETERRHEFFFENADRFISLKRTGRLHAVMSAAKPTWIPASALLPIPASDILSNPNLTQNESY